MTLADRCDAYARAFPEFPASHLRIVQEQGRDVAYGRWLGGNDYRSKTAFYGAYPPGYLERVLALFPDVVSLDRASAILHVFSGSLPPGPYERCDLVQPAEIQASVYALPEVVLNHRPRLICGNVRTAVGPPSARDRRPGAHRGRRRPPVLAGHDLADAPQGPVGDGRPHRHHALDESSAA
jgi:hypothetical protein